MEPLLHALQGWMHDHDCLRADCPIGVAVSGGADSVALAHALAHLNQQFAIIHVNHHLRGAESLADEQFVRALAASLKREIFVFNKPVSPERNLEETARDGRREVFHSLLATGTVRRIALAHTLDDQAETVLFRFLRGAHTPGLSGMLPVTPDGLIRPFLDVRRAQVRDWLTAHNLPWREDASNADLRFARNRLRHSLLPQLQAEWNPAIVETLANHARLAREDEQYWNAQIPQSGPILDVRELAQLPMAWRRRIVRSAIRQIKGDLKQLEFRHIQQVLTLASEINEGHGRLQVPGVDIMRSFNWLRFAVPQTAPMERDWAANLKPPGVAAIPGSETEIIAEVRDTLIGDRIDWERVKSVCGESLVVRNWRPGDRYRRCGCEREQKIKEMFQDARVPLWERRNWPILCTGGQIVWTRRFGAAAEFVVPGAGPSLSISERKRISGPV